MTLTYVTDDAVLAAGQPAFAGLTGVDGTTFELAVRLTHLAGDSEPGTWPPRIVGHGAAAIGGGIRCRFTAPTVTGRYVASWIVDGRERNEGQVTFTVAGTDRPPRAGAGATVGASRHGARIVR